MPKKYTSGGIRQLLALEYGSKKMSIPARPIVHKTLEEYIESGVFLAKVVMAKQYMMKAWK